MSANFEPIMNNLEAVAFITASNDEIKFSWVRKSNNQWVEHFSKCYDGKWANIHRVQFLSTESVLDFAKQLTGYGLALSYGIVM